MKYRHLTNKPNYADFASGKVLLGLPGHVATPLRLMDELFQSGLEILRAGGLNEPVTLYDPCCGTACHLAALAFLHGPSIASLLASDVNADVLAIARRNLDLLTPAGLEARMAALRQAYTAYGKSSHREALEAAGRLKAHLERSAGREIKTQVFEADIFGVDPQAKMASPGEVALVLSDLPYGQGSRWQAPWLEMGVAMPDSRLATRWLSALEPSLRSDAVICLLAPKTIKLSHHRFRVARHFQAGHRSGMILQRSN